MMKRSIPILSVYILIAILNSCDNFLNNEGGVTPTNTSSSMHSKAKTITPSGIQGGDLRAAFRFHTNIQAKGTFKPGELIRLSVSVRANLPTKNAEIKLFLPEIQALENKRAGQPATIPVGKPLEPQNSWSRSFSKGQTFSYNKTVKVKRPGYYHVFLKAKVKEGQQIMKEDKPIKNTASNNIWLWVTNKGGKMTQKFDSTLISKKYRNQAGPLTKKSARQQIKFGQQTELVNSSGEVKVQIIYRDYSSSYYRYFKYGTAQYLLFHVGDPTPIYTNTISTSNGEISIPCTDSQNNTTYKVYFYNKNDKLAVHNGSSSSSSAITANITGNLGDDCGTVPQVYTSRRTSHLFEVMNTAIENSRSFFQKSRGFIDVYAYDTGGGSYYSRNDDAISIYDKDNNNNTIGGGYGDFTAAHEYGHALHEKGLAGNKGGHCQEDDDDNDGHYVYEAISLRCAFSEGFADYHADAVGFPHFQFKSNPYVNNGENGAIIEGAVAAFFWDLTDPTGESFDNADYPGSYISNTIEDCEVDGERANGVDHLIACFQHNIPDYSNHFPTRSNLPSTYSENVTEPTGWDKIDIKKLWLKDLYEETYTPPPPPLTVSVTGSSSLFNGQQGTWTASPSGGTGTYSYHYWEYRYRCLGCTNSTWSEWLLIYETSSTVTRTFENDQNEVRRYQIRANVASGSQNAQGVATFRVIY